MYIVLQGGPSGPAADLTLYAGPHTAQRRADYLTKSTGTLHVVGRSGHKAAYRRTFRDAR